MPEMFHDDILDTFKVWRRIQVLGIRCLDVQLVVGSEVLVVFIHGYI